MNAPENCFFVLPGPVRDHNSSLDCFVPTILFDHTGLGRCNYGNDRAKERRFKDEGTTLCSICLISDDKRLSNDFRNWSRMFQFLI